MAPAAAEEWSVQNEMGCGLVGALFQRAGGSKPSKSLPSPRAPAAKNQITVDARRRRSSSDINHRSSHGGGGDHRQRTPRKTTMPPPQVANLAYTQRLRREPTFTSSELSVTIVGRSRESCEPLRTIGRKANGKDIDQAKALSKILASCSEAQRVKDWAALLKQSQSALSLGSDSSPQILAMKAEALVKLQRHEEAYNALVKWPAFDTEQCTSLFGSAKTAYFLGVKAQVLMAIGRFEDAVSGAKQAAVLDRSSEQNAALLVKKMAAAAAARSSANDLFKASKFAEAAAMNTQGLGHDPCNAVLLYNRAACRFKLGLFEKALEDCTAALNLRPSYRKARTRRADCNIKLERWEAAIQDCEVLIQETPGDEAVRRLFTAAKQRLDRQRQEDYGHRLQLRPRSDLIGPPFSH
nr:inactive TPR repeat-containing thioredoxin TTL3-like [Ipomoea batatas]